MRKTKFSRILSVVLACMLTLSTFSVAFSANAAYDELVDVKATGVTVLGGSAGKSATSFDPLLNGSNATTNDSWSTVADSTDVYITFDLGKSVDISKVVLTPRVNGWAQWFNAYKFYVTDDAPVYGEEAKPAGLPETAALEGTSEWLSKVQDVTYEFPANTTGRYITLYMDKLIGGYYVSGVKKYNVDDDPNTPEDNAATVIAIGEAAFYVAQKASDALAISTTQLTITTTTDLTNTYSYGGNEQYGFGNLADNNIYNTGCSARGVTDFYVTFDVGSVQSISQLEALSRPYGAKRMIKDYEIFVSETAPTYDGKGTYNEAGSEAGPAPTGIGTKAAEGTFTELTYTNGSRIWSYAPFEEPVLGRYVTLHVKSIYDEENLYFDVCEIKILANTVETPFTTLEVDYEAGKLVMPKADHYTATIASSSNTDVVALDGMVNTTEDGTSEVVLKFEFTDGTVGYTAPFDVTVTAQKDEVTVTTTQQTIVGHSANALPQTEQYAKFSNMYDGNLGSNGYTHNGINDFYVTFEMETAAAVSQITVTNHNGLADQGLKDYEIYVSETAPTYTGEATAEATAPAPTGIGKMVATGSLPKQAAGSKVQETNTITCETTYGRYVTLHAKTVNFDGTTFTSISEFKIFADTIDTSFTTLEIDYENGKLIIPEIEGCTTTIASSSDTDVVGLDGTVNTAEDGTSKVVLKLTFTNGTVGYTAPLDVTVTAPKDEVTITTTQQTIVGHSTNTVEHGTYAVFTNMYDGKIGSGNVNGFTKEGINDFYITFDIGAAASVSQIKITNHAGLRMQAIKDYEIYVSETAPTYDGTGTADAAGPVPTGIGKKVASGSLPLQDEGYIQDTNTIACETTYGRYVTLHAINVHNETKTYTSVAEFEIYADTIDTSFTSLEVDYENGKLIIPEIEGCTATVAASSNTDVVALDGTVNTAEDGTSKVVLKLTFTNGTVGYTAPFDVAVTTPKDEVTFSTTELTITTTTDLTNTYSYGGNEQYGFGNLADNNIYTTGCSARGVTDFYVTFDVGSVQSISQLEALSRPYGAKRMIKDYEIFVSETMPTYYGKGTYNEAGSEAGPAPTGIGTKAAEGTFTELTYTNGSRIWSYAPFEEYVLGRYVTLHVKSIYDEENLYFDVSEIKILSNTVETSFTSLEVDYENGKLIIPEVEGCTATIAASSNTDVVALDGTVNTTEDGTSEVMLKFVDSNGLVAFAKYTVNVEGRIGDGKVAVGGKAYETIEEAMAQAKSGDTITLYADVETKYLVLDPGITLNLNGKTLTTSHAVALKGTAIIDRSSANTGKLVVEKDLVALSGSNGSYLPVYHEVEEGTGYYTFSTISKVNAQGTWISNVYKYSFWPMFETFVHEDLAKGAESSTVKVALRLTWTDETYSAEQDYFYKDEHVATVVGSFDTNEQLPDDYAQVFTAMLKREDADVTSANYYISVVLISETGVEIATTPHAMTNTAE